MKEKVKTSKIGDFACNKNVVALHRSKRKKADMKHADSKEWGDLLVNITRVKEKLLTFCGIDIS